MGFFDFLLGESPETTTQTLDTLTPEQQAALNQLLKDLSGPSTGFEGDTFVDPSQLSQLSLQGLEERAAALGNPDREGNLNAASIEALLKILDFESADAGIEEFFRTNIRDPAVAEFQKSILPAISRDFGGANFFGSERAETDRRAQGELVESLTQARTGLAFNARESDRNRALQALGLVPAIAGAETNELLNLLSGGEAATGLAERNVGREFEKFLAESGVDATRIQQLLAAINTTGVENVVTTTGGTEGIIGPLLGAAGTILGGPIGGAVAGKIGGGLSKGGRSTRIQGFSGPQKLNS